MPCVYFGSYLLLSLNFRDISDFSPPTLPRDMMKESYVKINNISCFRNRGILETGWELHLLLRFIQTSFRESKVMESPWLVYVSTCVCVHLCMCPLVYVSTCTCVCVHLCMCPLVCVHLCMCPLVCVSTCVCVHLCVSTCVCVHLCVCPLVYVSTCTCVCVHLYLRMCPLVLVYVSTFTFEPIKDSEWFSGTS